MAGSSSKYTLRWSLIRTLAALLSLLFLAGIADGCSLFNADKGGTTGAVVNDRSITRYTFEVVRSFPHDSQAFTQGLVFENGALYESTGLNGRSSLRKMDLPSGNVLMKVNVSQQYFAEGMTIFRGKVFQLTWKAGKGFIYDPATFEKTGEFAYTGEGWGLTNDDHSLIMSDGSSTLRFINPDNFTVEQTIKVTANGQPVERLNELEYVDGEIFANIWETDKIVRIDPHSGKVVGSIDLTGLLPESDRTPETDVLNGIAYDAATGRLFLTGKLWPKVFEVKLLKS
jgi:glutaminyl-peptide cyclotransferase